MVSTTEYREAAVRFADILLRAHHATPLTQDDSVRRCACGRATVMCEINAAARDAGLLTEDSPVGLGGAR